MKKTDVLTVSVPIELKKRLQERAEKESRTLSNLVTVMLTKREKEESKAACTR